MSNKSFIILVENAFDKGFARCWMANKYDARQRPDINTRGNGPSHVGDDGNSRFLNAFAIADDDRHRPHAPEAGISQCGDPGCRLLNTAEHDKGKVGVVRVPKGVPDSLTGPLDEGGVLVPKRIQEYELDNGQRLFRPQGQAEKTTPLDLLPRLLQ